MLIRTGESSIQLDVVEWLPDDSPRAGDVRLFVDITSEGFSGRADVWVTGDALDEFVSQLRDLEGQRQGTATLASMSPGALSLELTSVNSRGGMAVTAELCHHVYIGDVGPYRHGAKVGFEFDPTMLPEILASFKSMRHGPP